MIYMVAFLEHLVVASIWGHESYAAHEEMGSAFQLQGWADCIEVACIC